MPRKRREHEEHLEAIEPIAVVVVNDIAYLLEDLSEIVLDIAKLMKKRPDDVRELVGSLKGGPDGFAAALPPALLGEIMGAVFEVGGKAQALKAGVAADAGAEGAAQTPLGAIDPQKLQPEALEDMGRTLQAKAHAIEAAVAAFEKELLAQHPPA